jgi:hypothetical protein
MVIDLRLRRAIGAPERRGWQQTAGPDGGLHHAGSDALLLGEDTPTAITNVRMLYLSQEFTTAEPANLYTRFARRHRNAFPYADERMVKQFSIL